MSCHLPESLILLPEPIPALEPVKFSITSHRGCFGSCSFCALTHHQGRIVQSRSPDSIVREAVLLTRMQGFKGIIQDIGGPTANMYGLICPRWKQEPAGRSYVRQSVRLWTKIIPVRWSCYAASQNSGRQEVFIGSG